ncbi:phosphoribosylaminoimidazole synthetase [Bacillus canaveralius]|uniref:Phosphoribosylaminoimidazole synthetase n=1 Tax=Bacillus canaveralius TaxID=1403243 RepID=A0A2N5GI51_9BACI|nr:MULTISPECIES: phosphoribosylaminoimidazole synthetase [Bacillus]PLR80094.1 phosphoribosylaminoimidazole synthetase [Bacillus sp. V33-4]PLR80525.1 phosphoribosylaminoimidazole synthetase [Bacillus canaveralius]PLR88015.1 phosphoribosylaminoimidazole synthetase [Bacillus canaveralius]
MVVRCVLNEGYLFSPRKVRQGLTQKTTYNEITIHREYNVHGILFYEDGLRYLLFDDCETPYWYPADLFVVIDNKVPEQWYYKFFGYEETVSAIWGYYELVHSEEHFDGLSEQETKAIDLFLKRKKEIYN